MGKSFGAVFISSLKILDARGMGWGGGLNAIFLKVSRSFLLHYQ